MNKVNGYSNNATWRVHCDILGNMDFESEVTAEELKDLVEAVVFRPNDEQRFMKDYAQAFINQVNFYEIAELINKDIE